MFIKSLFWIKKATFMLCFFHHIDSENLHLKELKNEKIICFINLIYYRNDDIPIFPKGKSES